MCRYSEVLVTLIYVTWISGCIIVSKRIFSIFLFFYCVLVLNGNSPTTDFQVQIRLIRYNREFSYNGLSPITDGFLQRIHPL